MRLIAVAVAATALLLLFFASVSLQVNAKPIDYTLWSNILSQIVDTTGAIDGIYINRVNYTLLMTPPLRVQFDTFLLQLQNQNLTVINLTRHEFFAYYINSYNALAIAQVINNPCQFDPFGNCSGQISGIRDIGTYENPVWTQPAGVLGGQTVTLQYIENLLRKQTPGNRFPIDPRVHAAIVCASISCPNLAPVAYSAVDLDRMMNHQFGEFLKNSGKGMYIESKSKTITLSSIFDWYKEDFEIVASGVLNFIMQGNFSLPDYTINWLHIMAFDRSQVTLNYFDYNWNLNGELATQPYCGTRPCYPLWAFLLTIFGILFACVLVVLSVALIIFIRKRKPTVPEEYEPVVVYS